MEHTDPQAEAARIRPRRARSSYSYTAAGLVRLDMTTLHAFRDALASETERVDAALGLRATELHRETTR